MRSNSSKVAEMLDFAGEMKRKRLPPLRAVAGFRSASRFGTGAGRTVVVRTWAFVPVQGLGWVTSGGALLLFCTVELLFGAVERTRVLCRANVAHGGEPRVLAARRAPFVSLRVVVDRAYIEIALCQASEAEQFNFFVMMITK